MRLRALRIMGAVVLGVLGLSGLALAHEQSSSSGNATPAATAPVTSTPTATAGAAAPAIVLPIKGPRAANPLKYVGKDSPERTKGVVKVTAECPSGYVAIHGGFDVHYLDTEWRVLANRPTSGPSEGEGWVVEASIPQDTGVVKPFTAYAVCAPESLVPSASKVLKSEQASLARNDQQLTPDCSNQFKAIGGGYSFTNLTSAIRAKPIDLRTIRLIRTQPNPGGQFRSWIVKAATNGRGQAVDLKAWSVCVRQDLVKDLRFFDQPNADTGVINANTPRCPADTYLLSGGGGVAEGDVQNIAWSHIRPGGGSLSNPPENWSVGAKDLRLIRISKITVHAHALCGRLGG
jgi:hypothetical protein